MECIIIAIPQREASEKIAGYIRRNGLDTELVICTTASAVLGETQEKESGIVICTEKTGDMNYSELFDYLPRSFEMILLSKNASPELFDERIERLIMPFRMVELLERINRRRDQYERQHRKKKKVQVQRTPEEQLVINRAKELLMKIHAISEPEAFRMIQKQSMDFGRSMVESAQMILLLNSEW